MIRSFSILSVVVLIGSADVAGNQFSDISSIPIWPKDGVIPVEWKDRYVFLDLDAGQMVLAYPEGLSRLRSDRVGGALRIERFDLKNQVAPVLSVTVRRNSQKSFTYEYKVANLASAKKAINNVRIPTRVFGPDDSILGPVRWGAAASRSSVTAIRRAAGVEQGYFLVWYTNDPDSIHDPDASAIRPGQSLSGFKVKSGLMPGFTIAYVQGGDLPALRKDMPEAVLEQTDPIMQIEFNSQNMVTMGPKFSIASPKSHVAEDFRAGIDFLIEARSIQKDSPAILGAQEIIARCIDDTNESPGQARECRFDSTLLMRANSTVEMDILHAMNLNFDE